MNLMYSRDQTIIILIDISWYFFNLWPGVTVAEADGNKPSENVVGEEYEFEIEYIEEEIEEEIPTDDESLAVLEHDQSLFTAKGEESEAESIPEEKNGGPTNGTFKAWNNFTTNMLYDNSHNVVHHVVSICFNWLDKIIFTDPRTPSLLQLFRWSQRAWLNKLSWRQKNLKRKWLAKRKKGIC